MALNLMLRPLETRAAHVTARGGERPPLSQAVRVLLKADGRPVLVESIRQNSDGTFTGEICAPKSDSPASAGPAGRESVHFREAHVFTYETAEDLVRRGMAPEMRDVVRQFDRAKFDDEPPMKTEPDELSEFRLDTSHWDGQHPATAQASLKPMSQTDLPPNAGLRPGQRLSRLMPIGAVCITLITGVGVGYILGHKSRPLEHAAQEQASEPAYLRLDYDLKKR